MYTTVGIAIEHVHQHLEAVAATPLHRVHRTARCVVHDRPHTLYPRAGRTRGLKKWAIDNSKPIVREWIVTNAIPLYHPYGLVYKRLGPTRATHRRR